MPKVTQPWHSLTCLLSKVFCVSYSHPYTVPRERQRKWQLSCAVLENAVYPNGEGEKREQPVPGLKGMNEYGVFWKTQECLWLCLSKTINKYICMPGLIILDPFMQNICNDGEMLSHILTHSLHFNCPSKINKNKLNVAFFMASNLLANLNGLPVFPNTKLAELWRSEKGNLCQ